MAVGECWICTEKSEKTHKATLSGEGIDDANKLCGRQNRVELRARRDARRPWPDGRRRRRPGTADSPPSLRTVGRTDNRKTTGRMSTRGTV
ncbi:hypothetical protein [Streptomyces sp.]|uniref:hypothetical protein n=1 Tax=Streptomyces sp. TaxID=1931 RepID=UPI002D787CE8|nr:hypothetical protein [Streptomyces sp.]HET6359539.1 hypothetical protein [Streptomyces sp.]